jgi:hypothetical protein
MAAREAPAIGRVELVGGVFRNEERLEAGADRARPQERNMVDPAVARPLVPLGDITEVVVGAFDRRRAARDGDDGGRDRQRVEIALSCDAEQPVELRRDGGVGRRRLL